MATPDKSTLELALKASNEGIWKWDQVEQKIYYSNFLLDIIGYPDRESAPHLFEDAATIYHPEDARSLGRKLNTFLTTSTRKTFGTECRYLHPDGSERWLRIRGACQRDENGVATILAGSFIEITNRKITELKLAEERHLLNLLTESIPVNIYFKDKDSRFVMANTATAQKLGLESVSQLLGKNDHDFFDARHADKSKKDEIEIMETHKHLKGTLEKELWDAAEDTWCITSKHPWLDHNGKTKGTFGVTNDVSEIVKTQIRLVEVAQSYKSRNEIYEQELKLACEVQQAILEKKIPSLPKKNSLTEQAHYACSASFNLSHIPVDGLAGDFYEVIPISTTKMGILMCDVMGHGVRASLIVAMIRGLISNVQDSVATPSAFLASLNYGLCHILTKAGITMFSTAIYGVIDIENASVTIANAGHPTPIINRNSVYELIPNEAKHLGSALGLISESNYHDVSLDLTDIDELIFFTDGIYEVVNSYSEELSIESLLSLMNSEMTSDETSIEALCRIAKSYAHDASFHDDVCILSAHFSK